MADEQKPRPKDDDLGVDFGDASEDSHVEESNATEKLDPKVYENANKHLAPMEVPGQENVFNVTRAFNDDAVEMGTIVSDKKHHHTPLGKSLKSAFTEWWGKTRTKLDHSLEIIEEKMDEKEPEQKPSDTDRSETVEKAKTGTVQPPKEDHHVIIEKSKTLPKDAARVKGVPFVVKDEPPKPATWDASSKSPDPEKPVVPPRQPLKFETPDLRKDMIAPVVGKRITKDIHEFETPEKKSEESKKKIEKPVEPKDAKEKKLEQPEVRPKTLPPIKPKKTPKPETTSPFVSPKVTTHSEYLRPQKASPAVSQSPTERVQEPVSQAVETKPVPQIEPEQEKPTLEEVRARLSSQKSFSAPKISPITHEVTPPEKETVMHFEKPALPKEQNNRSVLRILLWVFVPLVLLGAIVVGILYAISAFDGETVSEDTVLQPTTTTDASIAVPSFFTPDTQIPIVLANTKNEFFSALSDAVPNAPNGVTQFYPVRQTETVLQNVTTKVFFNSLNLGLRQNAVGTLDEVMMLGAVSTLSNEPFIIIRSYNFDSLFAGLLAWEPSMYEDLMPLFGNDTLSQTKFTDAVESNSPIRVLYNDEGGEVMLYAFINRTTVVITSSTAALAELLTRF